MALMTRLEITKIPKFSLTDEEYKLAYEIVNKFTDVEVKTQNILYSLYSNGVTRVSFELGISSKELSNFISCNTSLIDDFNKKQGLSEAKRIVDLLNTTRNLNKICGALRISKNCLMSILLKHVSISDAEKYIERHELSAFLSSKTYTKTVRKMSYSFDEDIPTIKEYLSTSALERAQTQKELEIQILKMVGLTQIGMNKNEIAEELQLNPKFIMRMLSRYEKECNLYNQRYNLFNRVKIMKSKRYTPKQIADKLELNENTVHIILEKIKQTGVI